jgi:transcriptional regulator with XRE-family HTH domain
MENFDLAKRVKDLRTRKGLSQEQLADISGLSLRTIQRIENGKTLPRGDSLKRLAVALQVSQDEIIDWQMLEDKNVLVMLNLSQLGFLSFPLLGIILPLVIWLLKKDKVKDIEDVGKLILNFQISWTILFLFFSVLALFVKIPLGDSFFELWNVMAVFYIANVFTIIKNTIRIYKGLTVMYKPAFGFLQ